VKIGEMGGKVQSGEGRRWWIGDEVRGDVCTTVTNPVEPDKVQTLANQRTAAAESATLISPPWAVVVSALWPQSAWS